MEKKCGKVIFRVKSEGVHGMRSTACVSLCCTKQSQTKQLSLSFPPSTWKKWVEEEELEMERKGGVMEHLW